MKLENQLANLYVTNQNSSVAESKCMSVKAFNNNNLIFKDKRYLENYDKYQKVWYTNLIH